MNKAYRLIWSKAKAAWVIAAETVKGKGGPLPITITAVTVAASLALTAGTGHALPTAPHVASGTAAITTSGTAMTITNSANAIINWQGFSIGQGESTRFIQPSALSAVLNRVTGGDPSKILGALQSNGTVLLINPNGILFGPNARVDVNGLIASTLGISNQDFLAGRMSFTAGSVAGAVENQGAITTTGGGSVYLIAPDVTNSGVITAPNGDVLLAAGKEVLLVDKNNPEIALVVSAPEHRAINLGTVVADAGRVGMYGGIVRQKGIVSADSAVRDSSGRIFLKATKEATVESGSRTTANGPAGGSVTVQAAEGTTLVSGTIEAKGNEGAGGAVQVLGARAGLIDSAVVDANGSTGGGTVLIGGDYQGKNPLVLNAEATYMGKDATIRADATDNGKGGKVILWSDNATRAYGSISARGGSLSGNGGFVETSGKHGLAVDGIRVTTRALNGTNGMWLLDPSDINIVTGGSGSLTGGIFDPPSTGSTIDPATITGVGGLADTNVTIQTTGGVSGTGDITISNDISWGTTNALTLIANNNILFNPSVSVSGAGDINLIAGSNNSGWAVNPGIGNITLEAGSTLSTTGNVYFNAGNSVSQLPGASITANTLSIGNTNGVSLPGGISLPETNMVNTLAVDIAYGGSLTFSNGKALTIGTGLYFNGVVANDNTNPINIATTVGNLTVNQPILSDVLGGGAITLSAANTLALNAAVTSTSNSTPDGPIMLQAGSGGVTSNANGILTTAGLHVVSGGSVTLNSANKIDTLAGTITGPGNFQFSDVDGFTVGTVGTAIGLTAANGNIDLKAGPNSLLAINNNVQATTGSVSYVTDNLAHNAFTTTSGSPGKFVEVKPSTAATTIEFSPVSDTTGFLRLSNTELNFSTPLLKLGNSSMTGNIVINQAVSPTSFNSLSLITGGTITQTTGSTLTISNLNADGWGGVTLNESNNIAKLGGHTNAGNFSFKNSGGLLVGLVDVNNGITITGSGNVTLQSTGALSQSGPIKGSLLTTSSVGGTLFSTTSNAVTGFTATNTSSGNISFDNGQSLTINGISQSGGGNVTLKSAGNILVANPLTVAGLAGDITLSASGSFTNNVGAAALVPGTGGRWLVWSANPSGDVRGGLVYDFKQYAATYGVTTVSGSGDGFLYSVAPQLTPSLTGSVTKVYDGTQAATLTSSNYLVSGAIDGDTVVLNNPVSGTYDTKNASTGKTVTVTGLSATATNGSAPVYGYALAATTASAAIGAITPKALTVSGITAADKVYDGNLTAVVSSGNAAYNGIVSGDDLSVSATGLFDTKNAGSGKTVTLSSTYSGADKDNYTITGQAGTTAAITPKALTVSGITAADKIYDGDRTAVVSSGNAAYTGIISGDDLSVSATGLFDTRNAGSGKTVTLSSTYGGADKDNYTITSQVGTTASITPKVLTVSGITADDKVYDGNRTAVVSSGNATYTGIIKGDDLAVSATGLFDTRNAGTGKNVALSSTYSGADKDNYTITGQDGTTAAITPKALTVSGITAADKIYDGNRTAVVSTGNAAYNGIVSGDDLSVSATGLFDTKNAGSGKNVALSSTYSGADKDNYTITGQAGTTAAITPKALTVSGITAADKVYDGNRTAVVSTGNAAYTGIISGDDLSVSATGLFDTKNAGSDKTVALSSTYSGADKDNYTITGQAGTTAAITPKALTVSGITAADKIYDGNRTAVVSTGNAAYTGIISGDDLSISATGLFDTKNVGSDKNVSLSSTYSGADKDNYTITGQDGTTAAITPKALTVSGITAADKIYDGNRTAVVSTGNAAYNGIVNGDDLAVSATGLFGTRNAGSGKTVTLSSTYSGADKDNYTITGQDGTTAAITPKALTVSGITAADKIYDGNRTAMVSSGNAAYTGIVSGDDLAVLATGLFDTKNVGSEKTVVLSSTYSGADKDNYTITGQAGTTAAITPKALTVSGITAADKIYDGNRTAVVSTGNAAYNGIVSGDDLSVSATGLFDTKNVGSEKNVTLSSTYSGADKDNYTITGQAGTTAAITPKALTVSGITAADKVYDGNRTAVVSTGDAAYNGIVSGDDLAVSATGLFDTRNAGTGKTVSLSSTYSGADKDNYTITGQDGTTAAITVRPLSTWTAESSGLWSNPDNWDALPDGQNVLAVSIPSSDGSYQVTYDGGATNLKNLNSSQTLVMMDGTLAISEHLNTTGLHQSGGAITGTGSLNVTTSFNQSGGSINLTGAATLTQLTGDMNIAALTASTVSLTSQSGGISQTGPIVSSSLTTDSATGTVLNSTNQTENFRALNRSSGNIELTNAASPFTIAAITQSGPGDVIINNTGATITGSEPVASGGSVSLTAHSPLTIGSGGVTAAGDILLVAAASDGMDNLTINGPVTSITGRITLKAGDSVVIGAGGSAAAPGGVTTSDQSGTTTVDFCSANPLDPRCTGPAPDIVAPPGLELVSMISQQNETQKEHDKVTDKDKDNDGQEHQSSSGDQTDAKSTKNYCN